MEKTLRRKSIFENTQFRAEQIEGTGVRKIRGYPILFETPADIGGGWKEIVDRHALDGTDLSKLLLVWNHDLNWVLAKNGINMTVAIDDIGLFVEAEMLGTPLDEYIWTLVSKSIVDSMSFWFAADKWMEDAYNKVDRIMHYSIIYEVSILPFAAYQETVAIAIETESGNETGARGEELLPEPQKRETLLRYIEQL